MKMKKILAALLSLTMVLSSATVFATENSSGGPSDSQGGGAHGGNSNVVRPVVARPTATVTELDVEEIEDVELTYALKFEADEATEEQLAAYGDWYADFVLTVNKDVTFNANGDADGYLAGSYQNYNNGAWISVPFENKEVEAGKPLKIMETAAEMMGEPGLKYTYGEVYSGVEVFDCGVYFDDEFLALNPDLVVTLELRIYNNEDEEETYAIGSANKFFVTKLPTATVTKLNVVEITEPKLTFAMNFKADEATDEQLVAYGDWYADFVLTVNKDVTFNANGDADGYLAGSYQNYNSGAWVKVPSIGDKTVNAGDSLKIMETAAEMMGEPGLKYTYGEVYSGVEVFDCGVYFDSEFLKEVEEDDEELEVKLELRIYNPENEEESYLIGKGYEFEIAHDIASEENVTVKADAVGETVVILDATVSGGAENVEKVTIDTTAVTEEKVTSVSIPKTTVESVKDIPVTPGEGESESEEGTALEIKLSDNEDADKSTVVTLDNAALNAIATAPEAASTDYLTIQVKKIEEHEEEDHLEDEQIETKENLADHHIYTINLVNSDGEDVPFTGGKVTIKLYYPQPQNGEVHVQHLTDEGELEEIYDFTYEAPFVTMTLEHFSEYVVYTKPVVVDDYEEPTDSYVPTYTVRFDTLGAGTIANQTVYRNETAEAPEAPVKEGYTFGGWYTDKACTNEYDFATKVIKNTVLYAKWTEATAEDNTPSEDDKTDDTVADWENNFTDVKDSDWYYESVKYVCENGLMTGSSETEFNPNNNLTRAMLVTVLYRADGEPEVEGTTAFVDVNADAYYAKAVVWGQKNGIINGYSDTEFAPDKNITREQIAAIIYRYAQFKGYDVSVGEDTNILSYDDALQISEYAVSAIQYTVGSKLINGKTASTLNPKDNATRAEIAAILQRFIEAQK